jgi:hypothetical protein
VQHRFDGSRLLGGIEIGEGPRQMAGTADHGGPARSVVPVRGGFDRCTAWHTNPRADEMRHEEPVV